MPISNVNTLEQLDSGLAASHQEAQASQQFVPALLHYQLVRSMSAAVVAGLALVVTSAAHSELSSVPDGSGPSPGPEILYWSLASSPQLANAPPWKADPILVSGASAYRKGEFLYQDYLYDDYGADGGVEPRNDLYRCGTYNYPTDPRYARNAADLVELRLQPLASATAVRITYNTMHDPELVATTIALGASAIAYEIPHAANARAPAQVFVTVHGSTADIVDAATGMPLADATTGVSVNLERRQVDVRIPYAAFDPRSKIVRVAAATGLWDVSNDRYLLPAPGAPDATHPGGGGILIRPTAFFNVAFRYTEPGMGLFDSTSPCSAWREQQQAAELAIGDLSKFFVNVDFTKLARHDNDDMRGQPQGVPETGFMSRILVSHYESAQGRGNAASLRPEDCADQPCIPDLAGRLQPYGIYIPTQPRPPPGYGLTIELHGATQNYNFQSDTPRIIQLGERGRGSIVITPGGRGPSYWYFGQSAADIFEVWADVSARYDIDSNNVAITGMSMGGFGAYKFAALFPDLFVAAAPVIPCVFDPIIDPDWAILPFASSYRHVPVFSWNMIEDAFCRYPDARAVGDKLTALEYRNEFLSAHGDHGAGGNAAQSDFSEVTEWLGDRLMERDPTHVTYVLGEHWNEPDLGVNADHAYWISNLRLRDGSASPPVGSVDIFSYGFGIGDAPALPTTVRSGVLNTTPPLAFVRESTELGAAPLIPQQNRLDIKVRNIRALTIDARRAGVDCSAELTVDTDGYVEIALRGCDDQVVAYGGAL